MVLGVLITCVGIFRLSFVEGCFCDVILWRVVAFRWAVWAFVCCGLNVWCCLLLMRLWLRVIARGGVVVDLIVNLL